MEEVGFEKSTHTETSTEACGWADRKEEADGGDGSAMDTCGTGVEPMIGLERKQVPNTLPRL